MKKFIPRGPYCYKILNIKTDTMGVSFTNIKPCSYYSQKEHKYKNELYYDGFCTKYQVDIDDQCKSCNLKREFNKWDTFIWKIKRIKI